MRDPESRLAKLLVAYYGLIEAAHFVVLVQAGMRLLLTGRIGFPAPPPPGGWAGQLYPFFVAMGVVDAAGIAVAWLFVYGYFAGARWRWWAGWVTLTSIVYSAVVFAWGTVRSGAWSRWPVAYLALAVAFVPVALLVILYVTWAVRGRLHTQGRKEDR